MFKNISIYFLAICVNFPCKIEKFELEVVGIGILATGFAFRAVINIFYRETTPERVTRISFLCLISLETVLF